MTAKRQHRLLTAPGQWRRRLLHGLANLEPDSLWLLALLGVFTGIGAGLAMSALRLLIELPKSQLVGDELRANYETLAPHWRLLLPTLGGLLIGLCFQRIARAERQLGVAHVILMLAQRDGLMPLKNAAVQFFGAAVSLVAGHSVGREGPSIHVGAACGSWMGQRLGVPNNNIRVLVGCGAAGAIAAAFNTPLAGVIFTMEVLLVEYTLSSFIPIILAAVCGTAVTRWAFGAEPLFQTPPVPLESPTELLLIVLMGIALGALSAGFVRLLGVCSRLLRAWPVWRRLTLAGALTGLVALPLPQVMGIGYDTVNAALLEQPGVGLLLAVLLAKLAVTAFGLGMGLPGGVIGPTLVIGAMAGGALGALLHQAGLAGATPALYVMLGMGAMMSATLNAPLAALTALLELTNNPQIIMPGMLAIVAANLTCQHGFTTASVFLQTLRWQGLNYRASDPIAQFLRRLSVNSMMDRSVQPVAAELEREQLERLLRNPPAWLLVAAADSAPGARPQAVFTADLVRYLEAPNSRSAEDAEDADTGETDSAAPGGAAGEQRLALRTLPIQRLDTAPVSSRDTLLATLRRMNREQLDALYVLSPRAGQPIGIITRRAIERSYRNSDL